jgi:hypothetical protein
MRGTTMIDNNWPNQTPIIDGVVLVSEVSQDPTLFDDDNDDDLEMED